MQEMLAKGLLRGVIFSTEDCDATFEHIRAGGGEVLQEPMDQAYMRFLAVGSAERIVDALSERQHLRPHQAIGEALAAVGEQLGICPLAVAEAILPCMSMRLVQSVACAQQRAEEERH
jgi:hypothetical protein